MTIARLRPRGGGIEAARVHEDWCPCNDKNIHHAHIAAAD